MEESRKPIELVFDVDPWEDGDYVVSVRPRGESRWKAIPLGPSISKRDAEFTCEWIYQTFPTILKIVQNMTGDDQGNAP